MRESEAGPAPTGLARGLSPAALWGVLGRRADLGRRSGRAPRARSRGAESRPRALFWHRFPQHGRGPRGLSLAASRPAVFAVRVRVSSKQRKSCGSGGVQSVGTRESLSLSLSLWSSCGSREHRCVRKKPWSGATLRRAAQWTALVTAREHAPTEGGSASGSGVEPNWPAVAQAQLRAQHSVLALRRPPPQQLAARSGGPSKPSASPPASARSTCFRAPGGEHPSARRRRRWCCCRPRRATRDPW